MFGSIGKERKCVIQVKPNTTENEPSNNVHSQFFDVYLQFRVSPAVNSRNKMLEEIERKFQLNEYLQKE